MNFDHTPVDTNQLDELTHLMAHRGRDCHQTQIGSTHPGQLQTVSQKANIGLGHRRLSVLDLSAGANQPMSDIEGNSWIVYNGEIFNYKELRRELIELGSKFRTQGDTEVILEAYRHWGTKCLERFNGMFAFALWDEKENHLFCARDPIGIKPLYLARSSKQIVIASESWPIAKTLRMPISERAVASYFSCMYIPGKWSLFRGIEKLSPGHFMIVKSNGDNKILPYWSLKNIGEKTNPINAETDLLACVDRAVKWQLRSDVPVGALLSGGLDSSLIVQRAYEQGQRLHTFSIGYEGHDSELPYARQIAKRCRSFHHERNVQIDSVIDVIDEALSHCSEPVGDSAIAPTYLLSKLAAEEGVKVLLNGTGGDEIFGGYNRYIALSNMRRFSEAMPLWLREAGAKIIEGFAPLLSHRLRNPGLDMAFSAGGSPPLYTAIAKSLGGANWHLKQLISDALPPPKPQLSQTGQRMLFDFGVYAPDELLVLLDQMTMAHTVEGRVPLMDIDLAQTAFELHPKLHVSKTQTKVAMKRMCESFFGNDFIYRKKQGFGGPVRLWAKCHRDKIIRAIEEAVGLLPISRPSIAPWLRKDRPNESPAFLRDLYMLYSLASWRLTHN